MINKTTCGIGVGVDLIFRLVDPLVVRTVTNFALRYQVTVGVVQELALGVYDVRRYVQKVVN